MALHNGGWQAFDDDYSGYFVEDDDANIVAVFQLEADADEYVNLRKRAEAAEAAALQLRLDLGSAVERSNRLAIWTDRYGADQWRRGNAGKDPQEFAEWRKEAQP